MPTLGNALDFAKYEARQMRAHILGSAPGTPVTGQLYYNSADNTLYWWDGSGWVSARGGASATPQATTSTQGTIQLAGDLAGTAVSPQIAAGVITDAEVAAANKDGAVGTPSLRTIGSASTKAMAGNKSLADIAQTNSSVAAITVNSQSIQNLAYPSSDTDAANKAYVDSVAQGLSAKKSVRAATTTNITLSGTQTVDGVALNVGDRVLVKAQPSPAPHGIYIVSGSGWTRAPDMDIWAEVPGAFVWVEEGTTQADTAWICIANQGGTLGSSAIDWSQFSSATGITAGSGLTKTGNTFDVGEGNGLSVLADTVNVASGGITDGMIAAGNLDPNKLMAAVPVTKGGTGATTAAGARTAINAPSYYSSTGPPGAASSWTITQSQHLCGAKRGLIVQIQDETSGAIELPDVVVASNGDITITWGASVSSNAKRATVLA